MYSSLLLNTKIPQCTIIKCSVWCEGVAHVVRSKASESIALLSETSVFRSRQFSQHRLRTHLNYSSNRKRRLYRIFAIGIGLSLSRACKNTILGLRFRAKSRLASWLPHKAQSSLSYRFLLLFPHSLPVPSHPLSVLDTSLQHSLSLISCDDRIRILAFLSIDED